jgi:arylsulfatase A-like enzyme
MLFSKINPVWLRRLPHVAAIAAICLCLCCAQDKPHLNLVLIGVDTLRPDHLGCYGYDRDTSPNIDDLAARGVLFEDVVAPSSWTLPSFATVFTSLYPTQHGASNERAALRANVPTLASILGANGYATGAIVNAPFLKGTYGVNRGFDFYFMTPPEGRVADGTTRDALEWIDDNEDGPFFMFVHYFDPHLPYGPPPPFDTMFDPTYSGPIKSPYNPPGLNLYRTQNFDQMESLSDADWDRIRSLYDGEIAFTDEAIGRLMAGLRERGLTENTLIVFLADHGEEFFEHHGFEHGHTLYDELIRVPLVFSLPGALPENQRVPRQVRLVDVMPTILDVLGISPWTQVEGTCILPLMTGQGEQTHTAGQLLPPEAAFSEAILYTGEKKSLSMYPWKIIYNMQEDKIACFNLAGDPGETTDLSSESPDVLAPMRQLLYGTILNINNTWFMEMYAGDKDHAFDIHVTSEAIRGAGHFRFHKIIDSRGNILNTDEVDSSRITPSVIDIAGLAAEKPVRLAFKLMQPSAPVGFDLKIDGEPAVPGTYIGRDLAQPVAMPFTEKTPSSNKDTRDLGEPDRRPDPPYCLIWLYRSRYADEQAMELDEATERELRSLGYIQ